MLPDKQHAFYLQMAYEAARLSPDMSTQTGALLVSARGDRVTGCNTFPKGVERLPERFTRPEKYRYFEHAERAVIFEAARKGIATEGASIYCLWAPCCDCARAIIEAGVQEVVTHSAYDVALSTDGERHDWQTSIDAALEMFAEAGVTVTKTGVSVMPMGESLLFHGEPISY